MADCLIETPSQNKILHFRLPFLTRYGRTYKTAVASQRHFEPVPESAAHASPKELLRKGDPLAAVWEEAEKQQRLTMPVSWCWSLHRYFGLQL